VWSSQRETLAFMHADPLIRKFVQTGLDVDKMVALLRGGDEYLTQLFERGGAVNLERAGATLEDTLTNLKASIESATGGSADVLESIHTGRLLRDAGGVATDRLGASSVSRQYDALQADAKALQARIDELPAGDANLRALHDQLISTNEKITAMEDRFDAAVLHKGSKYVSIKDSQAFANEIKRRWSTGDFEMPDQIRVNRYVAQGGYDAASIAEHLDQTASNLSSGAYRRFKSIGEMEAKWARGSFYQQRAWQ
jgi:hypothetical protein